MSIDRITLTHVRIPLLEPFRISNGSVSAKDGIIVRVHEGGLVGVGEASPMAGSFYSDDTPESVWALLKDRLVPAVLKARPATAAEAHRTLESLGGSPFARAGIETAYWDLDALKAGKPLWALLGGSGRPLESGLAVGIYDTTAALLGAIELHMREGYRRLKIKIEPGWDTVPLTEVRREFGNIPLMVDANCAYRRSDIGHLGSLDAFDLMMIEQPLPREDLEGHALLQRTIRTPVCLDESAEDIARVQQAIALESCRIINIKIQRVGGLTNAKAVHDLCRAAGIPVWAGTMPELGIGSVQTLHCATLAGFTFPTDVESTKRWFVEDIIEPPIIVEQGVITLPQGSGNCYALSTRALERHRVAEQVFRA
jgi:O-succinylbenzoate synthase